MNKEIYKQVKNNPKFTELVNKRSRFAWTLSAVMLLIYYSFILIIAFAPEVLGTPLSDTSVITLGIPVGIAIIVIAFVLTGIYVHRANGEFDELNQQIIDEVEK